MGCDGCELWNEATNVKRCYAGLLTERYGGHSKGYPAKFTEPQLFPERIAKMLCWSDLTGTERKDKPWLNGYPRTIFLGYQLAVLNERNADGLDRAEQGKGDADREPGKTPVLDADRVYEQILIAKLEIATREFQQGRITADDLRKIIDDVRAKRRPPEAFPAVSINPLSPDPALPETPDPQRQDGPTTKESS